MCQFCVIQVKQPQNSHIERDDFAPFLHGEPLLTLFIFSAAELKD
jgi:hypothetical protein